MNTNRRSFLKYCGMVSLGLSSSVIAGSQATKKKKPNVILFMTDDQGWGDVGFNGNKEILTPNMDGLVKGELGCIISLPDVRFVLPRVVPF